MLNIALALAGLWLGHQSAELPRPSFSQELRNTDCTNADQRQRLLDQGGAALEAVRPAIAQANTRLEARLTAHGDRLIERRVWTAADRERFNRGLFDRPEFRAYLTELQALVDSMLGSLETVMSPSADEVVSCRALLATIGQIDRSVEIGQRGWTLADRAYAEEAQRLGVSLD